MGCVQNKVPSAEISIIILSPPICDSPSIEFTLKPYYNEQFPAAHLPTNTSVKYFHTKFIQQRRLTWSTRCQTIKDKKEIYNNQPSNSCPYF
ncbi:unnamed protein product [Paramecium primaurelia]|uniref:Uncharacterized protein n=1 Tax=Paramecium primaurelia TaxID=5886 RepID=A0A8S1MEQ7_PARPR|nr:unnamed protein product [Paramecium primaurelia]